MKTGPGREKSTASASIIITRTESVWNANEKKTTKSTKKAVFEIASVLACVNVFFHEPSQADLQHGKLCVCAQILQMGMQLAGWQIEGTEIFLTTEMPITEEITVKAVWEPAPVQEGLVRPPGRIRASHTALWTKDSFFC